MERLLLYFLMEPVSLVFDQNANFITELKDYVHCFGPGMVCFALLVMNCEMKYK